MDKLYAVLTGDIIGSSRLKGPQLEHVRATICRASAGVGRWQRGLVYGEPDFFRGDAWQILLTDPRRALRAALFIRASLCHEGLADTRVAIGLGTVVRLNQRRISLSTGPAFALAGHCLDTLTRSETLAVALDDGGPGLAGWIAVVATLCGVIAGHWTRRQAEVVRLALSPREPAHAAIARQLVPAVSQQAVTKILNGADWRGLRSALRQFEAAEWQAILSPRGF